MKQTAKWALLGAGLGFLSACNQGGVATEQGARSADGAGPVAEVPVREKREQLPWPSTEWETRELENFMLANSAAPRHATDIPLLTQMLLQSQIHLIDYLERIQEGHWQAEGNLCWINGLNCVSDPYFYPGSDTFFDEEAEFVPLSFYDAQGTRLSGHAWMPRNVPAGTKLPAIVIQNGSIQAAEQMYWWFIPPLIRAGYTVLTFDPRGQGRSDNRAADGSFGTNIDMSVFTTGLVDAVDFILSNPGQPYAHNMEGSAGYEASGGEADTAPYFPFWESVDAERVGIVGHSAGAAGVSNVQAFEQWPGTCCEDGENPVRVIVAWDSLSSGVLPRVPAMNLIGDYVAGTFRKIAPPNIYERSIAIEEWRHAGVPVAMMTTRGGTHFDYSQVVGLPASPWSAHGEEGGWGEPVNAYYSLAWLDRWLKLPGETGYDDADRRLLDDRKFEDRLSFYYRTARSFPDRNGYQHDCFNVVDGCEAQWPEPDTYCLEYDFETDVGYGPCASLIPEFAGIPNFINAALSLLLGSR